MIRIAGFPPRCWLAGRRQHHGLWGLGLVTFGLVFDAPLVSLAGVVCVASDWHDRGRWLPDLLKHPDAR